MRTGDLTPADAQKVRRVPKKRAEKKNLLREKSSPGKKGSYEEKAPEAVPLQERRPLEQTASTPKETLRRGKRGKNFHREQQKGLKQNFPTYQKGAGRQWKWPGTVASSEEGEPSHKSRISAWGATSTKERGKFWENYLCKGFW